MAPGDVAVEPDVDQGETEDRATHHVVAPRNREVYRIEALYAGPGEMRVAEQRAGAAREIAAESDGVAAETLRAEVRQIGRIDQGRRSVRGPAAASSPAGAVAPAASASATAGGAAATICETKLPGAGAHQQLAQHLERVEPLERAHPGLSATILGEPIAAGIAQVAVVTVGVPRQQRAGVRIEPAPRGLAARIRVHHPVDAIRIQVRVVRAGAEPARLRAGGREHVTRQNAGVVLGKHVAVPVTEAAPVGGADVRNAVARAGDVGVVAVLVVAGVASPRGQQGQRGDDARSEQGRVLQNGSPLPSCSHGRYPPRSRRDTPARARAARV